jgi:hypothetical protein
MAFHGNIFVYNTRFFAGVAQLVEQLICNQPVAGSSPISSSKEFKGLRCKSKAFFVSGVTFVKIITTSSTDFSEGSPTLKPEITSILKQHDVMMANIKFSESDFAPNISLT